MRLFLILIGCLTHLVSFAYNDPWSDRMNDSEVGSGDFDEWSQIG